MKSIDQAIADLPPAAHVSVTCSPAKGIRATLEYTDRLIELGHRPIPHLAARMVEGPEEAAKLARWVRDQELDEVFVIAGRRARSRPDRTTARRHSCVTSSTPIQVCARVGVAGYPDGHAMIPHEMVTEQLHAKQALLAEHGVGGWISTQMCFDDGHDPLVARIRTRRWDRPAGAARCSGRRRPCSADDDGHPARHRGVDAVSRARTARR